MGHVLLDGTLKGKTRSLFSAFPVLLVPKGCPEETDPWGLRGNHASDLRSPNAQPRRAAQEVVPAVVQRAFPHPTPQNSPP